MAAVTGLQHHPHSLTRRRCCAQTLDRQPATGNRQAAGGRRQAAGLPKLVAFEIDYSMQAICILFSMQSTKRDQIESSISDLMQFNALAYSKNEVDRKLNCTASTVKQ